MIRLIGTESLPEPTTEQPWIQVEWIFEQQILMSRTLSSADNYRNAKKHFLDWLKSGKKATECFEINKRFNEYTLLQFKQYVDDLGLSSHHVNTILSSARKTVRTAISNGWLKSVEIIDFVLSPSSRETEARKPYGASETAAIIKGLQDDIRHCRRVLKPYTRSGKGVQPELISDGKSGQRYPWAWWRHEDNMRWYFENRLNCEPITGADLLIRQRHSGFLAAATNHHGGLHALYKRWGVSAWIGHEIILPYLFKLVALTGLNPTVAMALRLDDYKNKHPLTGQSYIRYWKERGSGECELHTDLIDAGVLVLDEHQSQEVKRIWEEVAALTAGFRHTLPPAKQTLLFVYQSRGVKTTGQAKDLLTSKAIWSWSNDFVQRHGIQGASGKPLSLTLARFRPSLVSRMVKRVVDIQIIKAILGHSSILTTLQYLDSHDFAPAARKEVNRALFQIRENHRDQKREPKQVATQDFDEDGVVFATGLAFCKNVFSPPKNIQTATGIKPGSPCTLFNMCLRCPNVLVMEENLPVLFALRRQYLTALDRGIAGTTNRAAILQNVQILNNLLDSEYSDWPQEVLAEAERRSEFVDVIADTSAIQSVGL